MRRQCGVYPAPKRQETEGKMGKRNGLAQAAQIYVMKANESLDYISEIIQYCTNPRITPEERNAKLSEAQFEVGRSGRYLDRALNPNGVFMDYKQEKDREGKEDE